MCCLKGITKRGAKALAATPFDWSGISGRMNTTVEIPEFYLSEAENSLSMLFHGNDASRNGVQIPFQLSGRLIHRT